MDNASGTVYLVGAGPGDPGLLTLRAAELLQAADVVVHDNLISDELLAMIPPSTRRIYVGKHEGSHTMSQDKISDLLVELSHGYACVVRLKGGNPFIFGRGGEEAEVLASHGVAFEVVPGISSGLAVPTYAGIPLTHRDHASSFGFITGHEAPDKFYTSVDWRSVAALDTLVIYMGLRRIAGIAEQLMGHGKAADTPVAVIRAGTMPDQAELYGRLDDIAAKVESHGLKPPAIIVVGSVVGLHEKLHWFTPQQKGHRQDVILLAHGSSAPDASASIRDMASRLSASKAAYRFHCAFLEREEPNLEAMVEQLCQQGCADIRVVPLFLSQGGHVQKDIPTRLGALRTRFPACEIYMTDVLGCGPWMDAAVLSRLRHTSTAKT
ncbi:MAG: uroporphyrinogen-III C-methyltransferase [Mariprofundaceae bacterium]